MPKTTTTGGAPAAEKTKAEKFVDLGKSRTTKAIAAIGLLEPLANKAAYEFTAEQADKIVTALEGAVAEVKARFAGVKKTVAGFDL